MENKTNEDMKKEFEENGYVFMKSFFSEGEIDELRQEIVKAAELQTSKSDLNKDNMIFYSNVYKETDYLRNFVSQEKIVSFMRNFAGPDMWVRWDQCVAKASGGAAFPWHQDNAYSRVLEPYFQLWIAVTEMTEENGGVWIQPGSHRDGLLPHGYEGNHMVCEKNFNNEILVKAEKGDMMLFSSYLLHHTRKNESDSDRWAYVVEYMSQSQYDPTATAPYFLVSKNGERAPGFVNSYPGVRNIGKRMKYFVPGLKKRARKLLKR